MRKCSSAFSSPARKPTIHGKGRPARSHGRPREPVTTTSREWTVRAAEVGRQARDVTADLPRVLAAPLVRRRHRTGGRLPRKSRQRCRETNCSPAPSTAQPVRSPSPPRPRRCGRGWSRSDTDAPAGTPTTCSTISAAAALARSCQNCRTCTVGQWLAMVPRPSPRTAFVVDSFVAPEWLLWRSPNRTWAWRLVSLDGGRTRLISRLDTVYEWSRPWVLLTVLLMEVGDYSMIRRMLGGIRERAESRRRSPGPGRRASAAAGPSGR